MRFFRSHFALAADGTVAIVVSLIGDRGLPCGRYTPWRGKTVAENEREPQREPYPYCRGVWRTFYTWDPAKFSQFYRDSNIGVGNERDRIVGISDEKRRTEKPLV